MHESQVAVRSARARQAIAVAVSALAVRLGVEEEKAKALLEPVSLRHGRDVAFLFELERLSAVLTEMAEKVEAPVVEESLKAADTPEAVGQALIDAGYDTPEKLRRATDEELLDIDGIGPARLAQIRAAHPFEPEAEEGVRPDDGEPGEQIDGAGQPVVEGVSQGDGASPAEEQAKALAEQADARPRPAAPPADDTRPARRGR